MKLSPREAAGFLSRPDPHVPALLIYGADPMRVADRRQKVLRAHVGEAGESEMRLTRMQGADLRRDPAAVLDAIKAAGFFPGPRAVFVEDATDGIGDALANALSQWAEGDALIVATAGMLTPGSKLRKLFEADRRALVLAVHDDPPDRAEIEAMLRAEGLDQGGAVSDLVALAQVLEPGDFRQTLTKIALYKHGDPGPLTPAEIAALAPQETEAAMDDVVHAAAEGEAGRIAPLMQRLAGQGVQPVGLCIAAQRHFRALHAILSHDGGASAGLAAVRPPLFGPRKDRMTRQARRWTRATCEDALGMLIETDLALRSTQKAPALAVMERALIRLAMMGRGR
jgi:DNA polymerase-3 subunit delta